MSGNVYEWCYDWYATYSGDSETDPAEPESGGVRVLRGGYWDESGFALRCASRYLYDPSDRSHLFGFRLCRTAE